ncbi:MAG: pantoate--beta-alanine ligase [Acidobacteria bacterium]|nr:pantoate--beta-alanine ligase [Acidobacteriota bacterium]
MYELTTVDEVRRRRRADEGATWGLVPTMGFLHDGHLALVERARRENDRVAVSLFVNPTQFGQPEDLERYPRDPERDLALLREAGADVAFSPAPEEIYPSGFQTYVNVEEVSLPLEGASRPGHFRGVATVVAKLFLQCMPDFAMFGEKDYQQLAVIRRMVADLNIPVDIIGVATVREADGLAMSSRNAYLMPEERSKAPALFKAISGAADAISKGGDVAAAVAAAREKIRDAGFGKVDYVEARHAETLAPLGSHDEPGRILAAAQLGRARLIDNVAIPR